MTALTACTRLCQLCEPCAPWPRPCSDTDSNSMKFFEFACWCLHLMVLSRVMQAMELKAEGKYVARSLSFRDAGERGELGVDSGSTSA